MVGFLRALTIVSIMLAASLTYYHGIADMLKHGHPVIAGISAFVITNTVIIITVRMIKGEF